MKQATNIDEVIILLEEIISSAKKEASPLGYFAVLYCKVTKKVKELIDDDYFDDNLRMERLDVIFANRYLKAYFDDQDGLACSQSWIKAFKAADAYWPIVLQHLLLGINAHISLDLGIAAAEVSQGQPIENLKNDFDKINDVLASLVNDVQEDLARIWPTLTKILKWTKKLDDILVNFSMEIVRDDAWKLAVYLSDHPADTLEEAIQERDLKVARQANIIRHPGWLAQIILGIVRLGERGLVQKKLEWLEE